MSVVNEWMEWAALAIEVLAVVLMITFIVVVTARWLFQSRASMTTGYTQYRASVSRSLLIGLELLVAADIVRTIALEATLSSLATLALLIVIRTLLGWALTVELEGRWPWSARPAGPESE
ncbi:MAG: DUF1622 domain-containing protein [Chitinophagaceae bacterium]|nr:DUF1622 domain-containing protein [Rubrivivax sp.]